MRAQVVRLVVGGGVLALVVTGAVVTAAHRTAGEPAEPSPAVRSARPPPGLPVSNLRVLTAAETRRLARYATEVHACLARNGIEAARPTAGSRSITVETVEDVGIERLASAIGSCAGRLGDPPSAASLQGVDARTVALTLPKQCLLDPKVTAR